MEVRKRNESKIFKCTKASSVLGVSRDGPVVKNTGCSPRGLVFDSRYPHAGSQPFITLLLEDPVLSSSLWSTRHTHMPWTDMHTSKTPTRVSLIVKLNKDTSWGTVAIIPQRIFVILRQFGSSNITKLQGDKVWTVLWRS